MTATDKRIVLCPHLSVEHFRGGEKWVCELAHLLAEDDIDVSVRALPYAPGGERRVDVHEVLNNRVPYTERWRHDLSGYDTAYVFYNPFSNLFFQNAPRTIAGIHSWVYISTQLYEPHYGIVPTAVKALYRVIGPRELRTFDAVHSVSPAYRSPHPNTAEIPNFVDTERFRPGRAPPADEFTVLSTAAHIPEKGWDTINEVARGLDGEVKIVSTGDSDSPHITDLGFLSEDELADAYARAHVVLHPSRVDADSMVIHEACASGTPVVTTPIAAHSQENSAILHAGTIEKLCDSIRLLRCEWATDNGYDERCRRARTEGEAHSVSVIYPQLKALLLGETGVTA